jgi:hypothetical protein
MAKEFKVGDYVRIIPNLGKSHEWKDFSGILRVREIRVSGIGTVPLAIAMVNSTLGYTYNRLSKVMPTALEKLIYNIE